jgi:hypothetical protein
MKPGKTWEKYEYRAYESKIGKDFLFCPEKKNERNCGEEYP